MKISESWLPEMVRCLRTYSIQDFGMDLLAGLTVGLVALPLAIAFGIASGVTPQAGLYTAIVAGGLISALGGSRMQIGGPTGAFVVIVAGIVAKFGTSGLAVVTMMAGVILVAMGLTGLGAAVKFIPRPVTIGFTNGIALLIASTQVKDFLGLTAENVPTPFIPRIQVLVSHLNTINWAAAAIAIASIAIVILLPRFTRRVPASIVAMLACTILVTALKLPIETIGSKFGAIPSGFPKFSLPDFRVEQLSALLPSAFTVALLAALESLLSAVVADSMSGTRHNSNVELVAQGIANFTSPLFGGIPATGAIARTATNIRAGARSPVSGITHSATLLLIVLVAAPLARYIPLATLAAVLLIVAYNMGEWREIGTILQLSLAEIAVWGVTFALTVLADLTVAVEVGMLLAALLYIHRISRTTTVLPVTEEYLEGGRPHVLQDRQVPAYVAILRIHGPFLFGTTQKLADAAVDLNTFPPVVILRLRNMTAIDATGLHAIEVLAKRLRASGRTLLLCGAREQPSRMLRQSTFVEHLGSANILPHIEAALARAADVNAGFGGVGQEIAKDLQGTNIT
jgi:SulP family sulfate permease